MFQLLALLPTISKKRVRPISLRTKNSKDRFSSNLLINLYTIKNRLRKNNINNIEKKLEATKYTNLNAYILAKKKLRATNKYKNILDIERL